MRGEGKEGRGEGGSWTPPGVTGAETLRLASDRRM